MVDDLYFPEELSEEDRQLWFKELELVDGPPEWGLAKKNNTSDLRDLWRLSTRDWSVKYERVNGVWRLRDVQPKGIQFMAWEDIGQSIVNVSSIEKLELYSGDEDAEK
jgi:hypothetical protein